MTVFIRRARARFPLRAVTSARAVASTRAVALALAFATASIPLSANEDDWSVIDGEGITVTREPPASALTDVVSGEELAALNGRDALSALEKSIGLAVTSAGGYGTVSGFSLRGFGSGRVAILIDGLPVNSAQNGAFDLSSIDTAAIDKIEVTYGGSDSRFGASGAVGGTVNVVTKTKTDKGFGVSFDASSLAQIPAIETRDLADTQRASVSLRGGNGTAGWEASSFATRAGNAFAYEDADGSTKRRDGNRILDGGASASLAFDLPSSSSLDFTVSAYGADRDVPGALHAGADGKQTDFSLTDRARLDLRRAGSDRLGAEAALMHSFTRNTWEDRSSSSTHALNAFTAVNRWSYYASDALQVSAAADARLAILTSTNTGTVSRADGGVNASAEWYASPLVTVTPSARLALSGAGVVPVPRLGVRWKPSHSSALEFRHNAYRVYKLPNLNDLYWAGDSTARGNPDLECEDGAGMDGGVAWDSGGPVTAEFAAYASWHRNAIQWQSRDGVWSPENVGEATFAGFDAKARATVAERVDLTLAWSFLDTRVLTGGYDFSDAKRIPYEPAHRVNLGVAWTTDETDVRIRAHFESERFTTVVNVARLDPFFTLGASASKKIGANWTVYAEGDNLLGASYVTVEGYPMPRATVTVGCKATFGKM